MQHTWHVRGLGRNQFDSGTVKINDIFQGVFDKEDRRESKDNKLDKSLYRQDKPSPYMERQGEREGIVMEKQKLKKQSCTEIDTVVIMSLVTPPKPPHMSELL